VTGVYVVDVEMRRSSGYVTAPTGRRCAQPLGKTEPDRKRLAKTKLAKRLVHCELRESLMSAVSTDRGSDQPHT
jgi:hypothetical protein